MRLIWTVGAYAGREGEFPPHIGARMLASGRAVRPDEGGAEPAADSTDVADVRPNGMGAVRKHIEKRGRRA